MTSFKEFGLSAPLLAALAAEGYASPTPIQAKAIPAILAGHDVVGIAQTGTGKTAAFALPILERLSAHPLRPAPRSCRVLVISPTRELASQIAASFKTLGARITLSVTTVFGGVGYTPQIKALGRGLDVLVATPGRLLDHIEAGHVDLGKVEVLVLDEVDQMLDLGFVRPIQRIVRALPRDRQNLFFSATMPPETHELAEGLLRQPVEVSVAPVAACADRVEQRVVLVEASRKREALVNLFGQQDMARTIVFTRTKRGADRIAEHLGKVGISASAIHGNKSQGQRERALATFRAGSVRVLVATDVAARGIDIEGVTHVVNYELPDVAERYVHRIGRTARAGAEGVAISLCDNEEQGLLREIEKLTHLKLPRTDLRNPGEVKAAQPRPTPKPRPAKKAPRKQPAQARGRRPAKPPRTESGTNDSLAGMTFMRRRAG